MLLWQQGVSRLLSSFGAQALCSMQYARAQSFNLATIYTQLTRSKLFMARLLGMSSR